VLHQLASAHPRGAVFWADSRLRADLFRHMIVKGNRAEIEAASLRAIGRVDYAAFCAHAQAPFLVITAGGEGAMLAFRDRTVWASARNIEEPVDICGAGDSFSAAAALALKITGDPAAAAAFGNLAASITIMKKGTGTASPSEMLERSEET
jgi:sugar/nucleoside kinase (ribokinase family)